MRKEITTTTCDFGDVNPVVATNLPITFAGYTYEIDLCQVHVDAFLEVMGYLKKYGRKTKLVEVKQRDRKTPKKIRKWAIENGKLENGSRGRIPTYVVEEYNASR